MSGRQQVPTAEFKTIFSAPGGKGIRRERCHQGCALELNLIDLFPNPLHQETSENIDGAHIVCALPGVINCAVPIRNVAFFSSVEKGEGRNARVEKKSNRGMKKY